VTIPFQIHSRECASGFVQTALSKLPWRLRNLQTRRPTRQGSPDKVKAFIIPNPLRSDSDWDRIIPTAMSLAVGTRLGPHDILAPIGASGTCESIVRDSCGGTSAPS
jgi:hypothetical protein